MGARSSISPPLQYAQCGPVWAEATLYREQGKYEEAEPLFQHALEIREQQLGPEHPYVAQPLNGLADLYREQKKYVEAKSLYQRARSIWERNFGLEHPDVAWPINGLASLYSEQGKYEEAEPLFQHALEIREQQLGSKHPLTERTRKDYATFLQTKAHMRKRRSWKKIFDLFS